MSLMDKSILNDENKKDLAAVKQIISDFNLKWTWKSVYKVAYNEETDWDSLRIYDGKLHNITVMILAGLPDDKQDKDIVFDVLEAASDKGISPQRLHKFLYEVLQEKHFFMDTPEMEKMRNLVEADNQDQIALQNLMSALILKLAEKETLTDVLSSIDSSESNSNNH